MAKGREQGGQGVVRGLRDIGQRSAPSLILVIFGEVALRRGRMVWSETLLTVLGELGVETAAARRAIQRTAVQGVIESEKVGRRVRWGLTAAGESMLKAGLKRLHAFVGDAESWDGRWLVLSVSVPETMRQTGYSLRTRLTWLGLGSPMPGQWVTPHVDRAGEVARTITELDLDDRTYSYIGAFGPVGSERRMVAGAWDLPDLEARYDQFIETFDHVAPQTGAETFVVHVDMLQAWRRFPFVDPTLPRRLLPERWRGREAAEVFRRRHREWGPVSQAHWAAVADGAETS